MIQTISVLGISYWQQILRFPTTWIKLPNRSWFSTLAWHRAILHTHREHMCLDHIHKKHTWHTAFYFLLLIAHFLRVLHLILKESMLFLKRKNPLILGTLYYFILYLPPARRALLSFLQHKNFSGSSAHWTIEKVKSFH